MGKNRDVTRLERVAGSPVRAALLVDRPKGFVNAKGERFGDQAELGPAGPPPFVEQYERSLDCGTHDLTLAGELDNGVFLGVTDMELVMSRRGPTGRAKELVRKEPLTDVTMGWLDDEMNALHTRYLHLSFADRRWCLLATPWKRLIPDEAEAIVEALGPNAYRLDRMAELRDQAVGP